MLKKFAGLLAFCGQANIAAIKSVGFLFSIRDDSMDRSLAHISLSQFSDLCFYFRKTVFQNLSLQIWDAAYVQVRLIWFASDIMATIFWSRTIAFFSAGN